MSVRVRYAPSPTGLQHIGGLRTALFNYLFARSLGGRFFLRIEDTDRSRYDAKAVEDLYETLRWAGLDWDEGPDKGGAFGPYIQSERLLSYRAQAQVLLDRGLAYECFCSSERLEGLRKSQESAKLATGYDGFCARLSPEERETARLAAQEQGRAPVIRFRMPREGLTLVHDGLLGEVSHANADLMPDPVLLKSDGFPTYHLAHVVDDHLMGTTHVLRAREWLPSAPLHVLLFRAFGWEPPRYFHLPLILGQDHQKLSKRHGATSVRQFKEDGYLPEALVNYLALLGWSPGDSREFFTLEELERTFSLEGLNKAPAVFDYKKLEHFNAAYIKEKSPEALADLAIPVLQKAALIADPVTAGERETLLALHPLIRERLSFLRELPEKVGFFFRDVTVWPREDMIPKKQDQKAAEAILEEALGLLDGLEERDEAENEQVFRSRAEGLGFKLGDFMQPIRVAVTGSRVSPPLFPALKILGRTVVEKRLAGALDFLRSGG